MSSLVNIAKIAPSASIVYQFLVFFLFPPTLGPRRATVSNWQEKQALLLAGVSLVTHFVTSLELSSGYLTGNIAIVKNSIRQMQELPKIRYFHFTQYLGRGFFENSDSLLGNFLHETTALGVLMPAWEPHPKRTFKDTAVIVPFPRLVSFGN